MKKLAPYRMDNGMSRPNFGKLAELRASSRRKHRQADKRSAPPGFQLETEAAAALEADAAWHEQTGPPIDEEWRDERPQPLMEARGSDQAQAVQHLHTGTAQPRKKRRKGTAGAYGAPKAPKFARADAHDGAIPGRSARQQADAVSAIQPAADELAAAQPAALAEAHDGAAPEPAARPQNHVLLPAGRQAGGIPLPSAHSAAGKADKSKQKRRHASLPDAASGPDAAAEAGSASQAMQASGQRKAIPQAAENSGRRAASAPGKTGNAAESKAELLQRRLQTYEQPFMPRSRAEAQPADKPKRRPGQDAAQHLHLPAVSQPGSLAAASEQSRAHRRNARRARIRQQKNAAAAAAAAS